MSPPRCSRLSHQQSQSRGDAASLEMPGGAGEVLVWQGSGQERAQRGSCEPGTGRASSSTILPISHGSGARSP